MMYSVYYGKLSDARKENWDNGEENPFDWGSFAWKANKADILKLKKECNSTLEDAKFLKRCEIFKSRC